VNYWKVILATVVIFATGVMAGGLLVNYVAHPHPEDLPRVSPPVSTLPSTHSQPGSETNNPNQPRLAELLKPRLPEVLSKDFMQKLDNLLCLAPKQHDAIQKTITDAQGQMRKVIQDARQQIREQLTPDQRKQFEELMKRPLRRPPVSTNAPGV
jgi:uncharacterized membrane protein